MIDVLFQKSLEQFNIKHTAVDMGLIGIDDLKSDECYLAIDIANRKKIPIPERFLKEMTIDMLFNNLSRDEVINEIIERASKDKFELPYRDGWKKYDIPVNLQKILIPEFVKLDRKILKLWKKDLQPDVVKEIVRIRIKEGRKKAVRKEDTLLTTIKQDDLSRLRYYNLPEISKKRFLSVLEYWLKAGDRVKAEIFKTNHIDLLDENQYIEVLKSWLKTCSFDTIPKLKIEVFQKLPQEYQYRALEKFIHGNIKDISPLPSIETVKQIILPKLFADRKEAEILFLRYKIRFLLQEMKKLAGHATIKDYFNDHEVKQLRVIKKGLSAHKCYPSIPDLKLIVEIYEWVLSNDGNKRSALCSFFTRG